MDHAERSTVIVGELMGRVEASERVGEYPDRDSEREGLLRQAHRVADHRREGGSFDVLHYEVIAFGVLADVERLHDVRVPDARGELRLREERGRPLRVVAQVEMDELDGHVAAEPAGATLVGEVDDRHASGGDRHEHVVTRDPTWLEEANGFSHHR